MYGQTLIYFSKRSEWEKVHISIYYNLIVAYQISGIKKEIHVSEIVEEITRRINYNSHGINIQTFINCYSTVYGQMLIYF